MDYETILVEKESLLREILAALLNAGFFAESFDPYSVNLRKIIALPDDEIGSFRILFLTEGPGAHRFIGVCGKTEEWNVEEAHVAMTADTSPPLSGNMETFFFARNQWQCSGSKCEQNPSALNLYLRISHKRPKRS